MPRWYQSIAYGAFKTFGARAYLRGQGVEARGLADLPEGPFVLLADHANTGDAYVLAALLPRLPRFMANLEGVSPLKAALADLVGAYGRRKGATDLAALRRTFALAASGESLAIFPEGDRSWDGAAAPLRPGSARLVKKLSLPLVVARQRGNYLAAPRWAKTRRMGPWIVEFSVFDSGEVERLSEPLLESIIARAMEKDEIPEALERGLFFWGEGLAEGIERLLWRCPVCGKAEGPEGRGSALAGSGDELACLRCGARWRVDANQRVRPRNFSPSWSTTEIRDLRSWNLWQRAGIRELAAEGRLENRRVRLARMRAHAGGLGLERLGEGRLAYRSGELVFEPRGGSPIAFSAHEIRGFVDHFNRRSEFSHRGVRWAVEFLGGNASKWCYAFADAPYGAGLAALKEENLRNIGTGPLGEQGDAA